ncbi:54S ribosomal protein img2, mitochondrial [Hypsizygus marmoreus]|uniref:Large ribosomal subunit protein mL49 n=1 Tax=Hypsizygus marmoreus TaxID=39966 RepID=A0A369JIZ4_HYPMA|nr:54S ribosomal protein img2, mitochondrial [Hypsizygus marmoreus]
MLRSLQNHLAPLVFRGVRRFTQVAAAFPSATAQPASILYPYYVPRNTRGNLPVYTDVRNGGTRYLVLIRNVDGNANALAKELSHTLFEKGSPEAARMKIEIVRSKNLVISGGHWKNDVVEWLKAKGF